MEANAKYKARLVARLTPHPITTWREKHDVSQAEFARLCGMNRSSIANIETHRVGVSAAMEAAIRLAMERHAPGSSSTVASMCSPIESRATSWLGRPSITETGRGIHYAWKVDADYTLSIYAKGEQRDVELSRKNGPTRANSAKTRGCVPQSVALLAFARALKTA